MEEILHVLIPSKLYLGEGFDWTPSSDESFRYVNMSSCDFFFRPYPEDLLQDCFDLRHVYTFSIIIYKLLSEDWDGRPVVIVYDDFSSKKELAVGLLSIYLCFFEGMDYEKVIRLFESFRLKVRPMVAIRQKDSRVMFNWHTPALGLCAAANANIYDFDKFDFPKHVEMADILHSSWIIPGKILAMADLGDGDHGVGGFCLEEECSKMNCPKKTMPRRIGFLKASGIEAVVRLNEPTYFSDVLTETGINHHELPFSDGSVPSKKIVHKFFRIIEAYEGAVAIHCKAGIGRTGTLICAYLMNFRGFTCSQAVGWCRVVRPGSVMGNQQDFLCALYFEIKRLRDPSNWEWCADVWKDPFSIIEKGNSLPPPPFDPENGTSK